MGLLYMRVNVKAKIIATNQNKTEAVDGSKITCQKVSSKTLLTLANAVVLDSME
jgi:hypothetical protein